MTELLNLSGGNKKNVNVKNKKESLSDLESSLKSKKSDN